MPAKILIVDDELVVAESMRVMLRQSGYTVAEPVGQADAALEAIGREKPDLVLMDINLGQDQEGIELAERIRSRHSLPVVYVTAYTDDATLARAKITHPFGYVPKPFEARDLRVAIEIALHSHALEVALAAHAESYRTLLSTTLDGVIETDEQVRLVDVNQVYQRMTGYTREELLGMRIHELEAVESSDEVDAHSRRMRREGGGWFESRHRGKDGGVIDVEVKVTHIPGRGRFVAFIRNISERKTLEGTMRFLAERGTQPEEDFFRQLALHLAEQLGMDFVCIDRLEGDGRTARTLAVFSNGRFEDNISYTLKDTPCADVVDKSLCCFPSGVRKLFPRDAALDTLGAESYVGTVLWDQAAVPIGLIAVIGRKPLRNPELARKILQLVAGRAAGELIRLLAEEVRRATEAKLRESEEKYRKLVENAQELVWKCDAQGRFTYLNPAWETTHGYKVEEMLGRCFGEFQRPEVFARDIKEFSRHLAGGSVRGYETTHLTKDGRELALLF
ncbi:MAG: PAS domain S-box protein, partial [Verrucomicrobia bacterium]|nr:PAS domain S-box protein [Verrucomicrobiota bacterium]